jgi:hypothetical protein
VADLVPQGHASPESDHKHEGEDLNVRGILIPAGCLVAAAVAIHLGLWGLLTFFDAHRKPPEASLSPLARLPQEPPAPRLQNYPPLDLVEFRTRENAELTEYRWQDRSAGRVQIPVEKAKELFLNEYTSRSKTGAMPSTNEQSRLSKHQPAVNSYNAQADLSGGHVAAGRIAKEFHSVARQADGAVLRSMEVRPSSSGGRGRDAASAVMPTFAPTSQPPATGGQGNE